MEVQVSGPAVPRFSRAAICEFALESLRAARRAGAARWAPSELSIAFVDDAVMKKLNRRYRSQARTTDVLTFEGEETPEGRPLGEIVISLDQAKRQAAAEGHALATEVRYLILHGILHAFGWDHEADSGEMDALEVKLRPRVGLE